MRRKNSAILILLGLTAGAMLPASGALGAPTNQIPGPAIEVAGGPFTTQLYTGGRDIIPMTITNTGSQTLTYTATLPSSTEHWVTFPGEETVVSGSLAAGGSCNINLRFFGWNPGCETAVLHSQVTITHNVSWQDDIVAPVKMLHTRAPDIQLDPTVITFGVHSDPGDFEAQHARIYNWGCDPLTVQDIKIDNPPERVLFMSNFRHPVTILPGEYHLVSFIFAPPPQYGVYFADLFILSDDPDQDSSERMGYLHAGYTVPSDGKAASLQTESKTLSEIKGLYR